MNKIGFLFGNEVDFSTSVMENISSKKPKNIKVEPVNIGIIDIGQKLQYSVILDRFSNFVPFYKSVMKFFSHSGVKIVNEPKLCDIIDDFSYLTAFEKLKINVPKTAIFPSKTLPAGINGNEMRNLQYPLNWNSMFEKIKFPANIKSNCSSEFYDYFKVHSEQDFYSVYDMSGTNTLILQELIENAANFRIFVVGNKKFLTKCDSCKAPIDRYSLPETEIDKKTEKEIDKIIATINKSQKIDMYILDIAIAEKIYVLNLNLFHLDINNLMLPKKCYDWLVDETANLLIDFATIEDKKVEETKKTTKKVVK
jgi:hypothetical protein